MPEIRIKKENKPTRCDICHQKDYFDEKNNYCSRCNPVISKNGLRKEIKIHLGGIVWGLVSSITWVFLLSIGKYSLMPFYFFISVIGGLFCIVLGIRWGTKFGSFFYNYILKSNLTTDTYFVDNLFVVVMSLFSSFFIGTIYFILFATKIETIFTSIFFGLIIAAILCLYRSFSLINH